VAVEHRPRLVLHYSGQFDNLTVVHAPCLAVLDACRRLALFCPGSAEVAVFSREGQVIDAVLPRGVFGDNLTDPYPPLPGRVVVFLLAGHLATMAAGAIFVINQQTVSSHGLLLFINLSWFSYFRILSFNASLDFNCNTNPHIINHFWYKFIPTLPALAHRFCLAWIIEAFQEVYFTFDDRPFGYILGFLCFQVINISTIKLIIIPCFVKGKAL
jgi:hypothetical protein